MLKARGRMTISYIRILFKVGFFIVLVITNRIILIMQNIRQKDSRNTA